MEQIGVYGALGVSKLLSCSWQRWALLYLGLSPAKECFTALYSAFCTRQFRSLTPPRSVGL